MKPTLIAGKNRTSTPLTTKKTIDRAPSYDFFWQPAKHGAPRGLLHPGRPGKIPDKHARQVPQYSPPWFSACQHRGGPCGDCGSSGPKGSWGPRALWVSNAPLRLIGPWAFAPWGIWAIVAHVPLGPGPLRALPLGVATSPNPRFQFFL